MSSAAADAEPGRVPFADASPAQIRRALTPSDVSTFDRQWRAVMQRATDSLDLAEVHEVLQTWRQVAWVTSAHGQRAYQYVLESVEHRLDTGERADGAVPWSQLRVELGLAD